MYARRFALALLGVAAVNSHAIAQDRFVPANSPESRSLDFSGEEFEYVSRAWAAVHEKYEPAATISEFEISFARIGAQPPTIVFFKIPHMDGPRIPTRTDIYTVVVDDKEAHVWKDE